MYTWTSVADGVLRPLAQPQDDSKGKVVVRPALSRLFGTLRIGSDFFERIGARVSSDHEPCGVVDRVSDLSNPGIDVARIHPAIVAFFEDTVSLELCVESHWRFPFSLFWILGRPVLRAIGQFVLPKRAAAVTTRAFALDPKRDGRPDVRAIIREYADTREPMQVVAYATWERAGTRLMSAAFPLPFGLLLGALRLDAIGEEDGKLAVELTSRGGDTGIWYVTRLFALPLPLGERLRLWAADMSIAPKTTHAEATIIGRHEQRLFGIRIVTHDYAFVPIGHEPQSRT